MPALRWTLPLMAGVLFNFTPAPAQQVVLPEEVRTWLERDQAQRWRALLQTGDSIFANGSCSRCHAEGGVGGNRGPDLTDDIWSQSDGSLAGIRATIFWGVRPEDLSEGFPFPMNPAGSLHLAPEEYDALAAYVWSLSR